jgi:two-component sensor histidine kinase
MMTPDGTVQHANAAAATLFGVAGHRLKGEAISAFLPGLALLAQSPDIGGDIRPATRADGTALRVELRTARAEIAGQQCVFASLSDVSERMQAFEQIQRSLREKEVLLKEVHHRVKNNLQIISSLLRLQSDQSNVGDARTILEDCIGRVRSMAIVHEQLYGNESIHSIDLGHYASSLGEILRGTYAPEARLRVEADPVNVSIELATPLGLLLNEMISNAFKHGMPPPRRTRPGRAGESCDVLVTIRADADAIRLAITDSGPGFADGPREANPSSIGMELVRALSRQIGATPRFDSDEGLRVELVIPRR